ncbi:MAG: DUF2169 domain-containing protein [Deltaproteobacteria bacterium]|nr:DUF2169 domain-containing protein [Deltaproteobacteria bacterium]
MLQMTNETPFEASFFLFPDQHGIDTVYTVIKATFELYPKVRIAEEQTPVKLEDEFWCKPGESSLKYASEICLGKIGTDVVVGGDACALNENEVSELDVSISVASRRQMARVIGDRQWIKTFDQWRISPAKPFIRMPLIYERAYGGYHKQNTEDDKYLAEMRNPVGKGFLGKRKKDEIADAGVPNIVHPKNAQEPVGFSFIAPTWQPRIGFAGTYDEQWQKKRAPFLPKDFNLRYFNVAAPELIIEQGLKGGEKVNITGMSPRGKQSFLIPVCEFEVSFLVAGNTITPEVKLITVFIEASSDRISLSYMASVPCNKKVLQVEWIGIALAKKPVT